MSKLSHSKKITRKHRTKHSHVIGTVKYKLPSAPVDFKKLCNELGGNRISVPVYGESRVVEIDIQIDRGGRITLARSGGVVFDKLHGKQWVSLAGLNEDVISWAEREVNR